MDRQKTFSGPVFCAFLRLVSFKKPDLSATRWPYFLFPGITLVLIAGSIFDRPVVVASNAMSQSFVRISRHLTNLTTAPWILIVSAALAVTGLILAARADTRASWWSALMQAHQAIYVFLSVFAASFTVNIIKHLIGRARPELFDQFGSLSFKTGMWDYAYASFPSGHSTTSGALFAALALLYPRLGPAFVCLAIFFACARVAVGAHYPSDIVAGLFYGAWVSTLMACVFARHRLLFAVHTAHWPVRQ